MRCFGVLLVALLFVGAFGCGDDGEDAPPEAPSPASPSASSDSDSGPADGQIVIASGTLTAKPFVAAYPGGDFIVDQPGTLAATFTWIGLPAELHAFFRHLWMGLRYEEHDSGSPFTATVYVTAELVAVDERWQFVIMNLSSSGPEADVTYLITFTPD